MKKRPAIALLTDFGTSDSYVAAMKGVILSLCESAHIVDISHDIKPQDVDGAAYVLWSVFKYFPRGTIFVCVVDPGVGSARNILCIETKDYRFIAPDNGLLKFVLNSVSARSIRAVNNRELFHKNISNTFHGRDIFAPVAAKLANGLPVSKAGPVCKPNFSSEPFVSINLKAERVIPEKLFTSIISVIS